MITAGGLGSVLLCFAYKKYNLKSKKELRKKDSRLGAKKPEDQSLSEQPKIVLDI